MRMLKGKIDRGVSIEKEKNAASTIPLVMKTRRIRGMPLLVPASARLR